MMRYASFGTERDTPEPSAADCANCRELAANWGPVLELCRSCGNVINRERVLSSLPITPGQNYHGGWTWRPNAQQDIAALIWTPGSGEPGVEIAELELDRAQREERRTTRCVYGYQRLEWLRKLSPQYAKVVLYAYGYRGEVINQREGSDGAVADKCSMPGQRAAYRVWFGRKNKGKPQKFLDKASIIAFGNRLTVCATLAYDRDEWPALIPEEPEPERNAHERFIDRVMASYEEAKAGIKSGVERIAKRTAKT